METKKLLHENPNVQFCMIRLDITRFQLINSFYGMEEGNKLLIHIANKIKEFLDYLGMCVYGRIEADIFAICLPYSKAVTLRFIRLIRDLIRSFNLNYDIMPSFGINVIEHNDEDVITIYENASLAAKKSKNNYVNYYAFYNPQMRAELYHEQVIVNKMHNALVEDQFVVFYQPKYDLETNEIAGAEALVRWKTKDGKFVPAGDFIPVFEKNGFISKLDYYVWEHVCKELRRWMDMGIEPLPISVNVSRVNFHNPKLVEIITNLVDKYEIPHQYFNLELTESAYTDNPDFLTEVMSSLQKNGFVIMMDDFGSGYSSLNMLKDISVDVLKIDMKFFEKEKIEGRGRSIIASVIRMAKMINISVIAEGVEDKSQIDFLKTVGCEYVQGFYFARPLPFDEYNELLLKSSANKIIKENVKQSVWQKTFDDDFLITDQNPSAIFEVTNDRIEVVRYNDAYNKLFGYKEASNRRTLEAFLNVGVTGTNQYDDVKNAFLKCISENSYERITIKFNEVLDVETELRHFKPIENGALVLATFHDISNYSILVDELKNYQKIINKMQSKRYKIMIIDDEEINRAILREIFVGNDILDASNGKDALEMIDSSVDVILLDIVMPSMDGNKFVEEKKKRADIAKIPVVVISADSSIVQQSVLADEICDYIVKPFVSKIVAKRVYNVIESQKKAKFLEEK